MTSGSDAGGLRAGALTALVCSGGPRPEFGRTEQFHMSVRPSDQHPVYLLIGKNPAVVLISISQTCRKQQGDSRVCQELERVGN